MSASLPAPFFFSSNDGFGGGHNTSLNAMWNTCRETGDHGPMNSWQRQPFSSLISTGGTAATFASALSATHNNAINAGYGGSQAFDNDDGSSYYDTYVRMQAAERT